jgi:hypothetical protein
MDEYLTWATKQVIMDLQKYTNLLTDDVNIQDLYLIMDQTRSNDDVLFDIEQLIRFIVPFSLYMESKETIYESYFELIECYLEDMILNRTFAEFETPDLYEQPNKLPTLSDSLEQILSQPQTPKIPIQQPSLTDLLSKQTLETISEPETVALEPLSVPKPETVDLEPLLAPKPETVDLELSSTPKPETVALEPLLAPKPETVDLELSSTPKPETVALELSSTPKPETVDLEPSSTPEPETVALEPLLAPEPETVALEPLSAPEPESDDEKMSQSRLVSKCSLIDQDGNTVKIEKLGTRRRKDETDEQYEERMKRKIYDIIVELKNKNILLSRTNIRKVILNTNVSFLEDVLYSLVINVIDGKLDWDIEYFDKKILKQLLSLKGIEFVKTYGTLKLSEIIKENRSTFDDMIKFDHN